MSLAALKQDLSSAVTSFPHENWADAIVGDDLKVLEKKVSGFEQQALMWRTDLATKFRVLSKGIASELGEEHSPKNFAIVLELVDGVLGHIDDALLTLSRPMHTDPDIAAPLETMAKMIPSGAKFVRKLLRRVERSRVLVHSAYVDVYYGLLALKADYDPDSRSGERFTSGEHLMNSLRQAN